MMTPRAKGVKHNNSGSGHTKDDTGTAWHTQSHSDRHKRKGKQAGMRSEWLGSSDAIARVPAIQSTWQGASG